MHLPTQGDRFGRYVIGRRLGSGGMGVVHLATDTVLDRTVALKLMWPHLATDPIFRQRFDAEARALARIDSEHIVAIFDHGVEAGVAHIATQYVDGGDLAVHLSGHGALSPQAAARICAQVADALQAAHAAGVIHRDVKPSNVLLRSPDAATPHAYLCDFGIAQTDQSAGLTMTGSVSGTWSWLAPERVHGQPATPASDVYSLGCVLWACLSGGAPPFTGPDVEVASAHISGPVPQVPAVDATSRRLNDLLARSLAKHPLDRYRTAAAFRDDLLAFSRTAGSGRASNSDVDRPRARHRAPLLVAAVALLVAVGGIGIHQLVTRTGADSGSDAGPESGKAPAAPVDGDVNGDGLGDVMLHQVLSISPEVTSQVVTMTSNATGFDAPEAASVPGAPYHSELLGDVDGDGRPDRLDFTQQETGTARAARTNKVAVTPGQGDSFTRSISIPGRAWAVPYLGDLDADGRDDVVLVSNPGADVTEIWVALASDDGFARPTSWLRARGLGRWDVTSMVPGDFDGDGDHDLAVRQELTSGRVRLRFIESTGSSLARPGPPRTIFGETYNRPDLIAGDFDGDGTDELLENLLTQGTFDASIHRLHGGRFSAQESWAATPTRTETPGIRVTASDVDGDGDDDLVRLETQDSSSWTLDALVSNGSGFDAPSHETTYECTALCKDFRVGFVTRGG